MIVKAPKYCSMSNKKSIFLAGSIEMGKAELWQERVAKELESVYDIILDPRRDDFDSAQEQSIKNQYFSDQVHWELENIGRSSVVFFYFQPDTLSPISMLELGNVLATKQAHRVVVCCPDGFWRKGNIDIICHRHSVIVYETLEEAIDAAALVASMIKV